MGITKKIRKCGFQSLETTSSATGLDGIRRQGLPETESETSVLEYSKTNHKFLTIAMQLKPISDYKISATGVT